jgi:Protein of unknown function (DUF4058)
MELSYSMNTMASPFPGMNPYLESPAFWSEFHNRLMVAIADDLSPQLRPHYRVAIELTLAAFPLPLDGYSTEPIVELQRIFSELFERAGFDLVIDYQIALSPPLSNDLGI